MSFEGIFAWFGIASSRCTPVPQAPLQRIFVDVSTIVRHDAQTGIQRVVRSICRALGTHAGSGVTVHAVAATTRRAYSVVATDLLPSDCLKPWQGRLRLGPGDVFLGLDLSAPLFAIHEPQLRRWRSSGAHIAVVVYDLLPLIQPGWFNARTSELFRRWLDVIGRRATLVLPISRTVQADLSAFLAQRFPERAGIIATQVLPLSGDIGVFRHDPGMEVDEVVDVMRSRPTMLMVGTIEPRKGHAIVLAAHRNAWTACPDEAPLLVIAGKPGWHTKSLQAQLRTFTLERDGVVWLEDVGDHRLDRLYRACHGVLIASLGEGYCLPLHEALAYGKPVLARDLPVLRELQAPGLVYFEHDDEASLAELLVNFARGPLPMAVLPDRRGWGSSVRTLIEALTALTNDRQLVDVSDRKNQAFI